MPLYPVLCLLCSFRFPFQESLDRRLVSRNVSNLTILVMKPSLKVPATGRGAAGQNSVQRTAIRMHFIARRVAREVDCGACAPLLLCFAKSAAGV